MIREQQLKTVDTLVNLGSDHFVQARVYVLWMWLGRILGSYNMYRPDTSSIFIEVGLGFHAEFQLDEVDDYIEQKTKYLQEYVP